MKRLPPGVIEQVHNDLSEHRLAGWNTHYKINEEVIAQLPPDEQDRVWSEINSLAAENFQKRIPTREKVLDYLDCKVAFARKVLVKHELPPDLGQWQRLDGVWTHAHSGAQEAKCLSQITEAQRGGRAGSLTCPV